MSEAIPEQWPNLWRVLNTVNTFCHPGIRPPVLLSPSVKGLTCTAQYQGIGICTTVTFVIVIV